MAQRTTQAQRKARKAHQKKKEAYTEGKLTAQAQAGTTAGGGLGALARKYKKKKKKTP